MTLQEIIEQAKSQKTPGSQTSAETSENADLTHLDASQVAVIIDAVKQAWDIVNKSIKQLSKQVPSVPSFAVSISLDNLSVTAQYNRDYMHQTTIRVDKTKHTINHLSQKPDLVSLYAHHAIVNKKPVYTETIKSDEQSNVAVFTLTADES